MPCFLVREKCGYHLKIRVISVCQRAFYAGLPGNNAYSGVFGLVAGSSTFANIPARSTINIKLPSGLTVAIPQKDQRRQLPNYLSYYNAPGLIVTYSEVALLLAVAKFRGWNVGATTANAHYKAGIQASIDQIQLYKDAPVLTGVPAFVASKNLVAGSELKQINTEMYLSLFMNPIEAFANWRRSGFPELLPVGTTGVPIPRRLQYTLNEIDQNSEEVMKATALITGVAGNGTDSFLIRVWWDKQ